MHCDAEKKVKILMDDKTDSNTELADFNQ